MSKMKLVEENTELEVGRFYNVRCAAMRRNYSDKFIGLIPVIGEKHQDASFGAAYSHYHIDARFISKSDHMYYAIDLDGKTNAILIAGKDDDKRHDYVSEIIIQKRKCKRLTTGIKPPEIGDKFMDGRQKAVAYHEWYKSMTGKSCKGKKCPHLGHTMHERDGYLVCPLHDLIGDIDEEIIIPREIAIP